MKNICSIVLLVLISATIKAQQFNVGDNVKFIAPAIHYKTELDSNTMFIENQVNYLSHSTIFKIVALSNDSVVITASPLYEQKSKKNNTAPDLAKFYNYKVFIISKEEFLLKAKISETPERLSIGILSLPFKLRLQDEISFESDFNLNSTLNINIRDIKSAELHFQLGSGIGGVNLTSSNSEGIQDGNQIKASALTLLCGPMIQYKKVQAGIYIGLDFINNQNYYKWRYQGLPWFGFGIGYQLFSVQMGESKLSQPQK